MFLEEMERFGLILVIAIPMTRSGEVKAVIKILPVLTVVTKDSELDVEKTAIQNG